ncbi:MAG: fatty acid oxidation complex subunit alpha FadJ [Myxococcota bacterium]|nr:fatty acid oxidation complex subunit alpha FadJ [Myxococcota bacterium]
MASTHVSGQQAHSTAKSEGSALSIERRADGVSVVRMDVPGEPVNTLRWSFNDEAARVFDELERDTACKAVVFTSGKKNGFIAGADISMLQEAKSENEVAELSRKGQRSLDRIATFRVPVVAAIHGAALGGGLEVAMACAARVASDDKKTKLGLPEVQLGVLPGAGGTQRLPRLVPIQTALDLLLTGKQLDAKRAKKAGLVDEVVPQAILLEVACQRALALAETWSKDGAPKSAAPKGPRLEGTAALQEAALTKTPLGRNFLFDQARKALLAKSRGNYPAPERILEVVRTGLEKGFEAGLEAEAIAFGELVMSPQAAQLMSIFFATNALKKDNGTGDPTVKARPVHKVGMLGAGLMGAGIAYVNATIAKIPVRLKDKDAEGVARGLSYVKSLVDTKVKRKRMSAREASEQLSLVTGTTGYDGMRDCEVVIEAVFEDLALKHRVLKDVERECGPRTIFASNTSSIPIGRIAEASARPENVIGMHYFSPVEKMPLLEIIVTPKTSPEVTATCVELGKKQGKTVIVVNDGVGFYTSRILGPLMNEAAFLLAEGVTIEDIDGALVDFGFPVGPITLLDEVGIDVAEKVGHIVHSAFGDRMKPPPGFEKLIADERFGRKNKRGFYLYDEKKKGKKRVDPSVYAVLGLTPGKKLPKDEIAQRCALQFVNEACLCFGEGILRSARDGDIGAIFGLGFPPFRGGPFRYVDTVGAREIVRRLERLRDRHGNRFAPAPVLVHMASTGATFHGESAALPGQHQAMSSKAA